MVYLCDAEACAYSVTTSKNSKILQNLRKTTHYIKYNAVLWNKNMQNEIKQLHTEIALMAVNEYFMKTMQWQKKFNSINYNILEWKDFL